MTFVLQGPAWEFVVVNLSYADPCKPLPLPPGGSVQDCFFCCSFSLTLVMWSKVKCRESETVIWEKYSTHTSYAKWVLDVYKQGMLWLQKPSLIVGKVKCKSYALLVKCIDCIWKMDWATVMPHLFGFRSYCPELLNQAKILDWQSASHRPMRWLVLISIATRQTSWMVC